MRLIWFVIFVCALLSWINSDRALLLLQLLLLLLLLHPWPSLDWTLSRCGPSKRLKNARRFASSSPVVLPPGKGTVPKPKDFWRRKWSPSARSSWKLWNMRPVVDRRSNYVMFEMFEKNIEEPWGINISISMYIWFQQLIYVSSIIIAILLLSSTSTTIYHYYCNFSIAIIGNIYTHILLSARCPPGGISECLLQLLHRPWNPPG